MHPEIYEGAVLGRCRLVAPIGHGSMGVVWEAWHTTLGIPVAVKILRESGTDAEADRCRDRFRQEAHIAARMNHPNLVRVLDFGEDHARPYLVMELVRGPTLEDWARQPGRCDQRMALKVAGHICVGLSCLHHFGVVHRDVKPSNVLIEAGKCLKISDLGLSGSPSGSGSGEIAGTPQYLAPECLRPNEVLDARSDLYSVGVVMYRLLFGRFPFEGSAAAILYAHQWEHPDWDLPEGVVADAGTLYMLKRLLEKDPNRRMQSAVEVVQACRDQVHRLDWREQALRERRNPSPSAPVSRPVRAVRSAGPTWKGIGIVRRTAPATWIPWVALAVLLLTGLVAAGQGWIRLGSP